MYKIFTLLNKKLFTVLLFVFISLLAKAQHEDSVFGKLLKEYENIYGYDQNLVNGIQYDNLYPMANGHPFLDNDIFYPATIDINHQHYDNLKLKYNIFDQNIIVEYTNAKQEQFHLIVNNVFVDKFTLNSRIFRPYNFNDYGTHFYQVVGEGYITVLYYWHKKYSLSNNTRYSIYNFHTQKHTSYLLIDNKLLHYRSRHSFCKLLPESIRKEVKTYIIKNNIKVRKSADQRIIDLVIKCNTLIQNNK
ncbi:MAG: hypothetical protein JXJ22_15175 [Bacteroidales bacterium]|nr:hypothetical protein [Bacteroidales bacterium]